MGLDMNPMARPMAGCESEFRNLALRLYGRTEEKSGLMGRLFGKNEDKEIMTARFQAISLAPYETIGAPIVGKDTVADNWVRQIFNEGRMPSIESEAEALENMAGYYALQAMDRCDGFPVYTHAYDYDGVDRTSFRGAFLPLCKGVLGEDLIEAAWTNMFAEELAVWGQSVSAAALSFAKANGVSQVIGQHTVEFEEDDPATKAHIADSAARWAAFWSARGHGSEAYF